MNITGMYPDKSSAVAHQKVDEETVVVSPRQRVVNVFNDTASRIWQLSDGTRGLEEIAGIIAGEFAVDKAQALADTVEFINELVDKKLAVMRQEIGHGK